MTVKIIGLIIGILVLGAGIYYLAKEKNDAESKKIYTVVSVVGGSWLPYAPPCCLLDNQSDLSSTGTA